MSFPDHHHHHYPSGEQQQPSMNSASYYPQSPYDLHMYAAMEDLLPTFTVDVPMPSPLLYDLSTVKHKLHQVETILSSVAQGNPAPSAVAEAAALMQDIVVAASSTVLALQQMMSSEPPPPPPVHPGPPAAAKVEPQAAGEEEDAAEEEEGGNNAAARDDVIEIDAADLLAKYTHHCQICGKGFKRDANLRMHMRAHGDEYKSSAALARPARGKGEAAAAAAGRRYSCPQEGCRWNRKHARFQPLKSMVCVKNHYRRSHCPKLYVCQRCGRKQFSVLSDLRTHEKHCGDLKWRCSCGTTFSRKDKLMGHAALFAGHLPILPDGSGDY